MILAALLFIRRVAVTTTVSMVTPDYVEAGRVHILQDKPIPPYVDRLPDPRAVPVRRDRQDRAHHGPHRPAAADRHRAPAQHDRHRRDRAARARGPGRPAPRRPAARSCCAARASSPPPSCTPRSSTTASASPTSVRIFRRRSSGRGRSMRGDNGNRGDSEGLSQHGETKERRFSCFSFLFFYFLFSPFLRSPFLRVQPNADPLTPSPPLSQRATPNAARSRDRRASRGGPAPGIRPRRRQRGWWGRPRT